MSEMVDDLEQVVRDLLAAEAARYEVPADLAPRTLAAVRRSGGRSRDRRSVPRGWLIVAAAAIAALLAVGVLVTDDPARPRPSPVTRAAARNAQDRASYGATDQFSAPMSQGVAVAGATASGDLALAAGASGVPAPQIARTADVEVQVDRGQFARKWREANEIAAHHGGFVVDSSAETVRGQLATGRLTARVPVTHLDAVVRDLRQLGTPIRVSETGRDVSSQLVDYDARVRNAQARENQLLELLRGTRTSRAVAEIRGQLAETRGEIEGLQAERAKVQAEVDFSTVQATVTEPLNAPKPEPKGRWNKAVRNAGDAIVTDITGLIVAVGYAAPVALLTAIAWQTRRRWRRRALER